MKCRGNDLIHFNSKRIINDNKSSYISVWRKMKQVKKTCINVSQKERLSNVGDEVAIARRKNETIEETMSVIVRKVSLFKSWPTMTKSCGKVKVSNNETPEAVPNVTLEAKKELNGIKRGKAAGENGLTTDLVIYGGDFIVLKRAELYTKCLQECSVPTAWVNFMITLIHKKGDTKDLENYRPSLKSGLCNMFPELNPYVVLHMKIATNLRKLLLFWRHNFINISHG
ncbi:uncharacterized protein [Palaemon carinicauda]|uniref:uncharacterized protein n=1 Tax=Palaemon carinicauda TaxID=392227 RepID=UPI0035B64D5B